MVRRAEVVSVGGQGRRNGKLRNTQTYQQNTSKHVGSAWDASKEVAQTGFGTLLGRGN